MFEVLRKSASLKVSVPIWNVPSIRQVRPPFVNVHAPAAMFTSYLNYAEKNSRVRGVVLTRLRRTKPAVLSDCLVDLGQTFFVLDLQGVLANEHTLLRVTSLGDWLELEGATRQRHQLDSASRQDQRTVRRHPPAEKNHLAAERTFVVRNPAAIVVLVLEDLDTSAVEVVNSSLPVRINQNEVDVLGALAPCQLNVVVQDRGVQSADASGIRSNEVPQTLEGAIGRGGTQSVARELALDNCLLGVTQNFSSSLFFLISELIADPTKVSDGLNRTRHDDVFLEDLAIVVPSRPRPRGIDANVSAFQCCFRDNEDRIRSSNRCS